LFTRCFCVEKKIEKKGIKGEKGGGEPGFLKGGGGGGRCWSLGVADSIGMFQNCYSLRIGT